MNKVIDELLVEATILGMLDEASSDYEDHVKQMMPGIGNKDVRISTALSYKGDPDFSQRKDKQRVYADAIQNVQLGIEDGQIKQNQVPDEYSDEVKRKSPERPSAAADPDAEPAENPARDDQSADDSDLDVFSDEPTGDDKEKDAEQDAERDAEESDAPEVTKGPMDNEQINEELDYIQDVTGKDKRLREDANPTETDEWTNTNIEPTPDNFSKWQQKSKRDRPDDQKITMSEAMDGVDKPYGFPEKYVEVLERMINTEGLSDPKKIVFLILLMALALE